MNTHMISFYTKLQLALARVLDDEEGQGLTEYALILALIAVIAIAALTLLGQKVTSELSSVATNL
ncbi:MAG: Flp family type IVb pilin [Solirubrobacteraceae bacterium]